MSTRRQGREWVVQLLFQVDLNPAPPREVLDGFWTACEGPKQTKAFAERIFLGVLEKREELDKFISSSAHNWRIERMGVVDRNVLRMALYELLYCPDIPPVVTINEAVDLAKFFSNSESGRFVNGILDRARKTLKRPARSADTTHTR
ncbi:MAG: transcription antitermination factor NusB [Lentisphaerae bacterium]|nr:transcription antitermination factor NusB [Lentisphaerota bacterium]